MPRMAIGSLSNARSSTVQRLLPFFSGIDARNVESTRVSPTDTLTSTTANKPRAKEFSIRFFSQDTSRTSQKGRIFSHQKKKK